MSLSFIGEYRHTFKAMTMLQLSTVTLYLSVRLTDPKNNTEEPQFKELLQNDVLETRVEY